MTVTSASSPPTFVSDPATIANCLKVGPDGTQRFDSRHQVAGVGRLGDALSGLADAHQREVSGVAFCSDYSGVFISVSHPSASLVASINEIRQTHPGPKLVVAEVVNGLTAQLAATHRLANPQMIDVVTSVGPNIYTGGLSVAVLKEHWPVTPALRRKIEAAATNHGAVTMPIDYSIGSRVTLTD
ncbi:MAG: hypothetical protein ACTHJM_08895 [Marmoricola sp.]